MGKLARLFKLATATELLLDELLIAELLLDELLLASELREEALDAAPTMP